MASISLMHIIDPNPSFGIRILSFDILPTEEAMVKPKKFQWCAFALKLCALLLDASPLWPLIIKKSVGVEWYRHNRITTHKAT